MNLFYRMQLPMGAKHPPPKEAEPVEYFSQLSATYEDCLIFYWRQILKIREAYIYNGFKLVNKSIKKRLFS